MYEQYFGLDEKPFSIQPDPSFLYWGRSHRLAYAMLEYGVLNHAGISVVTGEVGCGKTTLIHRLLDQLSDTHSVALLSNIQEGRGDLLSWVLMGFGQDFKGKTHVELFSQLQTFFISEYAAGRRIVLIIDEAQNLSLDMLEELRLLSNINAGKDQLLQLILVGQPQLKGLLNRPELLQLAQRVGSDFHLTPLNKEEVRAYIDTRISIAGRQEQIFTDRAADLIAEQSRGVPRIINVIADTALVYAFSSGDQAVGVELIRNVIRDKQDYGVFGIAADEEASLPPSIPSRADKGLSAFEGKDDLAEPKRPAINRSEFDTPSRAPEFQRPPAPVEQKMPPPMASPAQTAPPVPAEQKMPPPAPLPPVVAPMRADVEMAVNVELADADFQENAVAEASRPSGPAPTASKVDLSSEESAITGVIVVGLVDKQSPEAAIRSAGDGRAIVFVPTSAEKTNHAIARRAGAVVVDAGERVFDTVGRARNAGYRQLKKIAPHIRYVQFIDEYALIDPDWISSAEKFMERRPEVAAVEGLVLDREQINTGPADSARRGKQSGEIVINSTPALFVRAETFEAVGGFRGDLVVCETEDLCVRERRRGAHLWRMDVPMLIKNQPKRGFSQWWSDNKERGYRNAFAASLHGGPPERLGVGACVKSLIWGGAIPAIIFVAMIFAGLMTMLTADLMAGLIAASGVFLSGALLYALRLLIGAILRDALSLQGWRSAFFHIVSNFPEFSGAMKFWFGGKPAHRRR